MEAKAGIVIVGLLMLGGCDYFKGGSSQVAACEAFIKRGLVAPSTYERTHVFVSDSSMLTPEEFRKRLGDEVAPKEPRLRLRRVSISYEAQNRLGVPLPGDMDCQFKLTEEARERELVSPTARPRALEDQWEREQEEERARRIAFDGEDLFGDTPGSMRAACCLPPAGS